MRHRLSSSLDSLVGPYVHYCSRVEPRDVTNAIETNCSKTKIVEIDGTSIPDLKSLIAEINEKLGLSIRFDKSGDDALHWMRLEDLVATDIEFGGNQGCIVIIINAECALRSSSESLIRFAQAMHIAGDENANPMRHIHGVKPDYRLRPRSVHTVLCFNKLPRNVPNANLIKFVA